MDYLIELHYLPSIQYFSVLSQCKTIILEKHENFVKQSYRSRCHINTSQGPEVLIIPLTSKHGKTPITEVRIDYSQKWLNNHWRTLQSAYGNAPFFEYYADGLHKTLFKQHTFLYDFNYELLTLCLKWLKLDVVIQESLTYEKTPGNGVKDVRNAVQAKKGGLSAPSFQMKPYTQVFGNAFVNNLSLVDLVFCTGPEALTYVSTPV